eukprot:16442250-Heterocapsa_arctica.AAC.1
MASYMVADTGCQKMVAGISWHELHTRDVSPLEVSVRQEACKLTFGPSVPTWSFERSTHPVGITGHVVEFRISTVSERVPGLFSRPGFVELDTIPDIVQGLMHWRSLGRSSLLYLAD